MSFFYCCSYTICRLYGFKFLSALKFLAFEQSLIIRELIYFLVVVLKDDIIIYTVLVMTYNFGRYIILQIVRPQPGTSAKQGDAITSGTIIRLQHMRTRKWLHSHLHASPISGNLEVELGFLLFSIKSFRI